MNFTLSLRRFLLRKVLVSFLFCLWSTILVGQTQPGGRSSGVVPRLVQFSGVVKAASGKPLNGIVGITFALYKDEQGGVPLWMEAQNVQADAQGRYSIYLGATKSDGLPQDIFVSGDANWLGVQPEGQAEQPRTLLLSVPYALKASDAETIGGLPPSAFVLAAPAAGGNTPSPNSPPSPPRFGMQLALGGTGTVNFVPLWTPDGNTLGNSVIFQSGTGATAKIGINTITPASTLDVKGSAIIRGAVSLPAIGAANASAGKNSQPARLTASAFKSGNSAVNQNFQWQAEPVGNNTSNPSGSLNLLFASGNAQPAETGLKIASNGQFTFAPGQAFPGAGTITGVTAGSGLTGGGNNGSVSLSLLTSCANGQLLQWNGSNWVCAAPNPGTITGVTAGTDLIGGGTSGNVTLNLDTTKVPQLNLANTFTGNQTVNGNLSATGVVTGSAFNIGSNLFSSGSYAKGNAFVGFAGNTTTIGVNNTASGVSALAFDTTGSSNTASGLNALAFNTTGYNNTASGPWALYNNTTGSSNSAFGYSAGPSSSHPDLINATAIGANAEVDASNSMVLGSINGVNGATANTKVGIGTTTPQFALDVHGTGNFTGLITFAPGQTFPGTGTITGITAGTDLTGGGANGNVTLNVDTTKVVTAVVAGTDLTGGGTGGVQTLSLDTTKVPQLNAANTFTSNQTVNGNLSATGLVSGSAFNIGSNLFASGSYAGSNAFLGFSGNTTAIGTFNAASGFGALSLNTAGAYNTASGAYALQHNTTGNGNTASGNGAMQVNTTGSNNTASGATALANNTNGIYNTADGVAALFANTAGTYNTASGGGALGSNTTGYNNTGSGTNALFNNTTGHDNSAFGYIAGPPTSHPDLTNATAIGAYAEVDASNSLVLGSINGVNFATADTNVGIGVTAPAYRLHVGSGNNTFRVDGPPQGMANPLMASFGGTGDFAIDAVGFGAGRFVVKDSGQVGIGVANPSNLLTLRPTGGHAISDGWDVYSSRRWKTNIQTLNSALDKVEQLRGVSYERKETGKHEIGVIAEEVGQVLPEIVTYEANGKDARGVDYSRLTALLIEAVKQQQRQIRTQQALMQAQSAALRNLKSELRQTRLSLQKVNAQLETVRPTLLASQ